MLGIFQRLKEVPMQGNLWCRFLPTTFFGWRGWSENIPLSGKSLQQAPAIHSLTACLQVNLGLRVKLPNLFLHNSFFLFSVSTIFERRIPLCKCLHISPSNHSATAYFWKEEKEWMIFLKFISGPDTYQERICKFAAKQRTGKNWELIFIKCRLATPTCSSIKYLWLFIFIKTDNFWSASFFQRSRAKQLWKLPCFFCFLFFWRLVCNTVTETQ